MIDWFKSLFGKGTIVYELVLQDNTTVRAKIEYVGSLDTINHTNNIRRIELSQDISVRSWEYKGDF